MTLPYAPDDDAAADKLVNTALRSRNIDTWRHLTSPEYVVQTERVLRASLDRIKVSVTHRNTELSRLRDACAKKKITAEQFEASKREWQDWLGRTEHVEATIRQYLRLAADLARPLRGDMIRERLIETLRATAAAIQQHKIDTLREGLEPTPADRALWARLTVLSVRLDEASTPVTLAELAQPPEPNVAPTTRRKGPASDVTIMAARLLLELAADTNTASRAELTREWANRADHLDSGNTRGRGTFKSQVLGDLIRRWERDGMIRRVNHESAQVVTIVDADRLRQLAYPG